MKTVRFEQMKPEREIIGWMKFADHDMTTAEVSNKVEDYINANLHRFVEICPSMTELRWEYEGVGQGHYRFVDASRVEKPQVWVGKLTYDQMLEVMKEAVHFEDWYMVEQLSYQLRLNSDNPWKDECNGEFELPMNRYRMSWMTEGKLEEVIDEDEQLPLTDEEEADIDELLEEDIFKYTDVVLQLDEGDVYYELAIATRTGQVSFESNGQHVTNPFYDESLRFDVDPITYYGREKLEEWL